MKSELNDLLCCPWCGSVAIDIVVSDICYPIQYSARGSCTDCGAEEPCGSGVHDDKEVAIKEAREQWNTRET